MFQGNHTGKNPRTSLITLEVFVEKTPSGNTQGKTPS